MGAMHKHALPIEDASWLPAGCAENWETVLPHFWTAATVWAESAMKALRRMDREDLLISKFCVESVYGRFLVYSFQIVNGYALFSRTHLCRKLQRLIFLRGFPIYGILEKFDAYYDRPGRFFPDDKRY